MSSYIGLYYPFIHFKDNAWLKLTALYWDKMARIVPSGYTTDDPDTVKRLVDVGFIRNYDPGDDVFAVGDLFISLLQQHEAELQTRYNVSRRDEWPEIPAYMKPPPFGGPSGSDPRLGYVFVDKLGFSLQGALKDVKLAEADQFDPRWVGMHPKLAIVYTTALAEQMARTRGLSPVTDETLDHLAVTGCTIQRLAQALLDDVNLSGTRRSEDEIEAQMAMISLQSVIPKDIANVPVEKIIAVRKQHIDELAEFQEYIHGFVSDNEKLKTIGDLAAFQDHLDVEYNKELKPRLENLKKQLRWFNIETVTGTMNMSFAPPEAMVSVAALSGVTVLNPVIAAAGAIAFGMLKIAGNKHSKNTIARQASPAAYLLRIEKDLRPNELMSWISERAKKFRFPN